jgi:hypothetical protein
MLASSIVVFTFALLAKTVTFSAAISTLSNTALQGLCCCSSLPSFTVTVSTCTLVGKYADLSSTLGDDDARVMCRRPIILMEFTPPPRTNRSPSYGDVLKRDVSFHPRRHR